MEQIKTECVVTQSQEVTQGFSDCVSILRACILNNGINCLFGLVQQMLLVSYLITSTKTCYILVILFPHKPAFSILLLRFRLFSFFSYISAYP